MVKRLVLLSGLLVVIFGLIWFVASLMQREANEPGPQGGVMDLVPESAALLLRMESLPARGTPASDMLFSLLPSSEQQPVFALLKTIQRDPLSDSAPSESIATLLQDCDRVLSLHALGEGSSGWALTISSSQVARDPEGLVRRWIGREDQMVPDQDTPSGAGSVMEFMGAGPQSLFAVQHGQHLLLTYDRAIALQARECLTQGKSLASTLRSEDISFSRGKVESVYPVLMFPARLTPLLTPEFIGPMAAHMTRCREWASRVEGELTVEDKAIGFSGTSQLSDSKDQLSQRLQAYGTRRVNALSKLPSSAQWVEWEPLPVEARQRELALKYGQHGDFKELQSLGYDASQWGADLERLSLAGATEVALAYVEHGAPREHGGDWVVLLPVTSESEALTALGQWCADGASSSGAVRERGEAPTIIQWKYEDLFSRVMGGNFMGKSLRYVMPFQGALFFAQNREALLGVLDLVNRNQYFQSSSCWESVNAYTRDECSRLIYCHYASSLGGEPLRAMLSGGGLRRSLDDLAQRRELTFVLQMSVGKGLMFYNAVLSLPVRRGEQPMAARWRTRLSAPVYGKPQFVKSHIGPENEVLVQDEQGKLYLLDARGRILWQRDFPENLLGDAVQVDLYANGKLQYAFTTPSGFYVVDRNGQDVSPFPRVLGCQLSTPITVMDYDSDHHYRFAALCRAKHLHLVDGEGRTVEGFRTPEFEKATSIPLEHVRHAGKDYLVVCDSNRLYVLNRRGEERVPLKGARIVRAPGASLYVNPYRGEAGSLLTVTLDGQLASIDLTSGVSTVHGGLPGWREEGQGHAFFVDLKKGAGPLLIYTSDSAVYAGSLGKLGDRLDDLRAIKRFDGSILPWLQLFDFGVLRVGVVQSAKEGESDGRIWLLDPESGESEQGFPLMGSGPFSISRSRAEGTYILLTSSRTGELICYPVPQISPK